MIRIRLLLVAQQFTIINCMQLSLLVSAALFIFIIYFHVEQGWRGQACWGKACRAEITAHAAFTSWCVTSPHQEWANPSLQTKNTWNNQNWGSQYSADSISQMWKWDESLWMAILICRSRALDYISHEDGHPGVLYSAYLQSPHFSVLWWPCLTHRLHHLLVHYAHNLHIAI